MLLLSLIALGSFTAAASAGDFQQEVDLNSNMHGVTDKRAEILDGGKLLTLTLDKTSGSGFRSKKEYLFGRIDMQIKLVSSNSAGTVTAVYAKSIGVPFPKNQTMRLYSSLWNADMNGRREGGLIKTDCSKAYYREFNANANACTYSNGGGYLIVLPRHLALARLQTEFNWETQPLDAYARRILRWVQKS